MFPTLLAVKWAQKGYYSVYVYLTQDSHYPQLTQAHSCSELLCARHCVKQFAIIIEDSTTTCVSNWKNNLHQ